MSKKPLIITENDKRSILSMYGILTEGIASNVVITGKVLDKDSKPISAVVALLNVEENKYYTNTNENGEFKLEVPSIEEGDYTIGIKQDNPELIFTDINLKIRENKTKFNLGNLSPGSNVQSFENVTVTIITLTNINFKILYDNKPLNEYTLKITPESEPFNTLFKSEMNIYNPSLSFFKGGEILENLKEGEKYKINKIKGETDDFFYFYQKEKPLKNIKVTISNKEFGSLSKNFQITLNNSQTRLGGYSDHFEKTTSSALDLLGPKNEIIFEIFKPALKLKVYDEVTGIGIPKAEVRIPKIDKIFTTDENGSLVLNSLNTDKLSLNVTANNYLESLKKVNLEGGDNNIEIGLTKFDISGEILDNYKDNLFTIYGRARTDLGYDEALRIAKLDIVNKFLEKHKNRYKNVPKFENVDLDIETENVYHKPQKGETGKTVLIVKSKKKDIRDFLREYTKEEDIEVESEPLVFEDGDIKEALGMAYRYGKNLFVVLGLMDDENTTNIFTEINKNKNLVDYINKNSDLMFIPVDNKNKNYNYLIEKNVRIDRYPSLVVLQPKDLLGNNFDVIKNDQYFKPQTYFRKK
jgi:hypothetical protein